MHELLHALEHAFTDTLGLLPWLIVIYVALEILENKTDLSGSGKLRGPAAPLIGSVTGLIPQCGFSVMAAKMFEKKYITLGTLLAIFMATSDEALFVLLVDGKGAAFVAPMLVSKIFIGLAVGYAVDGVLRLFGRKQELKVRPVFEEKPLDSVHEIFMRQYLEEREESENAGCTCCGRPHDGSRPVYTYAVLPILHALKIALFIFLVNFVLGYIIELVGEDNFLAFMNKNLYLQSVITAGIGLIPNCASSVVVAQSFLSGGITFGAMLAGLCANAGLGFVVLLRNVKEWKRNLVLIAVCYAVSVLIGTLFNAFGVLI